MRNQGLCVGALLLLVCAFLGSCNGGSAPVVVAFPAGTQPMLDAGQSQNFTIMLMHDTKNLGVTWSLASAGTLSDITTTSVTYNAPAGPLTAAVTDHLTATSVADKTKSVTVAIVITPSLAIGTTSLPPGVEGTAYNQTVAVTGGAGTLTYSITTGSLPAGLTGLTGSIGAITGTPTGPNTTSNFTVKVVDSSTGTSGPQSATQALSIKISLPPAPQITTTTLPAGVEFTAYNQTVALTGGLGPFTWSVSTGALPAGLNLAASTGVISGTPTGPNGTASFTVKVTDSSNPLQSATQALTITINLPPAPAITTTMMADGVEFTPYNQTLTTSGGHAPLTFSISVGALPAGLTLNANTGLVSGSPTGPSGTTNFTAKVTDSSNPAQSATQALSITIALPQAPAITTTSLPNGVEGTAYSQTIATTGGHAPLTFSISIGGLPAGLTIAAGTGVISGTPTGSNGTTNFTAKVTDSSNPAQSATQALSITINLPQAPAITTTSLPNGSIGSPYTQTLAVTGGLGPFTWSLFSGTLPAGLSLTANTGLISGTPLGPNAVSNFTVQVTDSSNPAQSAQKALSITIAAAPLSITTTSLPNGIVGQAYNGSVQSAGGAPPVTWSISVGTLPSGLTLDPATGAITGSPLGPAGTSTFTVKVTDSSVPTVQTATKQLTIQIIAALSITTTMLPAGTTNTPYSQTLQSTGGTPPVTWSITVGALPAGLSLTAGTGVISGTPSGPAGTANFTVKATDSTTPTAQTATQALSITINVAPLAITTTTLPNGAVGTAYNQMLQATGGTAPVTWSITVGSLPAGLTLTASTGVISGTPTAPAGTANFTVMATDSTTPTAQTATKALSITTTSSTACGPLGSESLLSGSYAILLKGLDSSGNPVLIGGVLTFNGTNGGGLITAGTIDMNLAAGPSLNLSVMSSSSYGVGSDHRGCMVITTSAGTQNYRFSLGNITSGVASTGHVIGFDTTGPFTAGIMRKQIGGPFSNATANGSFAFGGSSLQNTAQGGGKFGLVGVIAFNGSGGITGGSEDINQNGTLDGNAANTTWPASPLSINGTTSSYNIASNGRGTEAVGIVGTSVIFNSVIYVVSPSEALFMTSDSQTTANHNISAGEALLQTGGPFSGTSVSGTYVGYSTALGSTAGTTATDLFLLSLSNPNVTGTDTRNDGGTFSSGPIHAGSTYAVASSGRTLVTGGGHPPVLYLVNSSEAFFLGSNGRVDSGFFQSQTSTSASGTYPFGTIDPEDANAVNASVNSGVATFASPNGSAINDNNSNGFQAVGQTNSFTFSIDSTGLVHIPSTCTVLATSTNCQLIIYVISPTKLAIMDTSGATNPAIQVADQ